MGMTVTVTTPDLTPILSAGVRRALIESAQPILEAAKIGAPWEEIPKHGVHLRDTGFVRLEAAVADGGDQVAVGFEAFWGLWQHERMDYHHDHGHAKFLELAVVEGASTWEEELARLIGAVFGE